MGIYYSAIAGWGIVEGNYKINQSNKYIYTSGKRLCPKCKTLNYNSGKFCSSDGEQIVEIQEKHFDSHRFFEDNDLDFRDDNYGNPIVFAFKEDTEDCEEIDHLLNKREESIKKFRDAGLEFKDEDVKFYLWHYGC